MPNTKSTKISPSLNDDLLTWLDVDNLPFSTVDTDGFQSIFKCDLPQMTLPSSDTLRLTTIPKVYSDVKRKVMESLLSAKTFFLMFDRWSDIHA